MRSLQHGASARLLLLASMALFCSACALVHSPAQRTEQLALTSGFERVELPALRAYLRRADRASQHRLTIYVESDGAPWPAANLAPRDPTPIKALVMEMAAADSSAAVAYLGRPCQYLDEAALSACDPALWTHGRFSETAVAQVNRAVEALKRASGANTIALAGYSGGGAMAALVAARRDDVTCLVSVAAPLDTGAWTRALGVSPLRSSLNPLDQASRLADLPQTHFAGARDAIVPPATIAAFFSAMKKAGMAIHPDFDHECCWARDWRQLELQSCLRSR